MFVCFKHRHLATFVCPYCRNPTVVGRYFKEPITTLAWQGAEEFVQTGETFKSISLTRSRICRFVGAMKSPACCEYLRLHYPRWYQQFTHLAKHPELL